MSGDKKQETPGPKPERLVIEDDPEAALDRLVAKDAESRHRWSPLGDGGPFPPGIKSTQGLYWCLACRSYTRHPEKVLGPCPPPDGSEQPLY